MFSFLLFLRRYSIHFLNLWLWAHGFLFVYDMEIFYYYLFWCWNFPVLGQWALSSWLLCPYDVPQSLTSLTFWHKKISQAHVVLHLQPWNQSFPQEALVPLVEDKLPETKIRSLPSSAHCYWWVIPSSPSQQMEQGNIRMYIFIYTWMYAH